MADVSYYLALPYTTVLRRDDEGDVIATIAELDGCIAHGADEAEAIRRLRDAQIAWLEAAIEAGAGVPLPEAEEDYLPSGKFVVRLPKSLHQRLNKLAKKDDVSLNVIMVMAASEHVGRREQHAQTHKSQRATAWQFPDTGEWDGTRRSVEGIEYLSHLRLVKEGGVSSSGSETGRHSQPLPKVRRG